MVKYFCLNYSGNNLYAKYLGEDCLGNLIIIKGKIVGKGGSEEEGRMVWCAI